MNKARPVYHSGLAIVQLSSLPGVQYDFLSKHVSSDDIIEGNEDVIQINYSREEVYVSRACGYKTIFRNITLLLDANDTDRWIINKENVTENQTVEDETSTHFILYH